MADQRGRQLDRLVHGRNDVSVTVAEERLLVDADAHEVGDLGELGARQADGDGPHDVVSELWIGLDGEQTCGLEVDEDVPPGVIDTNLGQGDARRPDRPRLGREVVDRHGAGHCPTTAGPSPRFGEHGGSREGDLHGPVGCTPDDDDPLLTVRQLCGSGAQGDVDPEQPFAGAETAQLAFRRDEVGTRKRDAGRWFGRPQPSAPTSCQQRNDARGHQGSLTESDR